MAFKFRLGTPGAGVASAVFEGAKKKEEQRRADIEFSKMLELERLKVSQESLALQQSQAEMQKQQAEYDKALKMASEKAKAEQAKAEQMEKAKKDAQDFEMAMYGRGAVPYVQGDKVPEGWDVVSMRGTQWMQPNQSKLATIKDEKARRDALAKEIRDKEEKKRKDYYDALRAGGRQIKPDEDPTKPPAGYVTKWDAATGADGKPIHLFVPDDFEREKQLTAAREKGAGDKTAPTLAQAQIDMGYVIPDIEAWQKNPEKGYVPVKTKEGQWVAMPDDAKKQELMDAARSVMNPEELKEFDAAEYEIAQTKSAIEEQFPAKKRTAIQKAIAEKQDQLALAQSQFDSFAGNKSESELADILATSTPARNAKARVDQYTSEIAALEKEQADHDAARQAMLDHVFELRRQQGQLRAGALSRKYGGYRAEQPAAGAPPEQAPAAPAVAPAAETAMPSTTPVAMAPPPKAGPQAGDMPTPFLDAEEAAATAAQGAPAQPQAQTAPQLSPATQQKVKDLLNRLTTLQQKMATVKQQLDGMSWDTAKYARTAAGLKGMRADAARITSELRTIVEGVQSKPAVPQQQSVPARQPQPVDDSDRELFFTGEGDEELVFADEEAPAPSRAPAQPQQRSPLGPAAATSSAPPMTPQIANDLVTKYQGLRQQPGGAPGQMMSPLMIVQKIMEANVAAGKQMTWEQAVQLALMQKLIGAKTQEPAIRK